MFSLNLTKQKIDICFYWNKIFPKRIFNWNFEHLFCSFFSFSVPKISIKVFTKIITFENINSGTQLNVCFFKFCFIIETNFRYPWKMDNIWLKKIRSAKKQSWKKRTEYESKTLARIKFVQKKLILKMFFKSKSQTNKIKKIDLRKLFGGPISENLQPI